MITAAEEEAVGGIACAVADGCDVEAGVVSGDVGGEGVEEGVEVGFVFAIRREGGVWANTVQVSWKGT